MPKASDSVESLPAPVLASLRLMGEHLSLARARRKESLRAWAKRMHVSVPTLVRMEKGDPRVGIGVYATALWLIGRDQALTDIAAPAADTQALAQEVLAIQRRRRSGHG